MLFEDFLVLYLITLGVFVVMDAIWIGGLAKDLYSHFLKSKLANPPFLPAAIAFYLLFVLGLIYFAIEPAITEDEIGTAAMNGALYGFFTFATYALTNMTTLKGWPRQLVGIDIAWGTVACFATAIISFIIFTGI